MPTLHKPSSALLARENIEDRESHIKGKKQVRKRAIAGVSAKIAQVIKRCAVWGDIQRTGKTSLKFTNASQMHQADNLE